MDIRLPVTADLHINAFSGGTITELESGITNGIVQTKSGKTYLTHRPSIDIVEDASFSISDAKGRGLFYWSVNSTLYMVNNDNLFKTNQGNSISSSIGTGTKRCYFFPIGGQMIFLDPENNSAFYVTTADAVTPIAGVHAAICGIAVVGKAVVGSGDGDFPVTLAAGGAVLNNALYVLDTTGVVYGSDSGDGTSFAALNFLGATRDPDGGQYLAKHHDNLAVFGPSSCEFFYDAGNVTGSPLSRRQDVTWNIGCAIPEGVWEIGDRIFFPGVDDAGAIEFYILENFQPRKISTPTIDSFLTQTIVKDSYTVVGSGFSAAGHDYYIVTFVTKPDAITPETTLVYDDTAGLWYIWYSDLTGITDLPVVAWTKRDSLTTQYGQGQLANGDIISVNDNLSPQDTLLGISYMVDDYVETGYVQATSDAGTVIALKSRTGMYDGLTNKYKYPQSIRFVGDKTPSSQTLTIKWADENNSSFNSGRSQDMSINSKEHRLGRFQRRNHEISYSGTDDVWIEELEIPIEAGSN